MEKFIKTSRLVALAVMLAALLLLYISTIYRLQVIEGDAYYADSIGSSSSTETVHAARGSILDRNGVLLVSDRVVYSISISRSTLLQQSDPNSIILELVQAARSHGIDYTDTFPITMSAPFSFSAVLSSTQENWLNTYFEYFKLDPDISATDFISWLRDHYGISYTIPAADARRIIGIRWELEMRAIIYTTDYVFADDVSSSFVAWVEERNLPSVSVETSSEREYHTEYAAHLLGYLRAMSPEQYENIYSDLDYPYDAQVGQSGVESTYELQLHGVDGRVTTYTDADGSVINQVVEEPVKAGDNVYLTIDIALQGAAERALASGISQINQTREDGDELADAGAVVALDVNTGDVLALVSYPTFDLSTFGIDYSSLSTDESRPLYNRATQGTYNPGSTFKMVTALTGLREGVINGSTTVEDRGIYMEYADVGYTPRCWIYPSNHGVLDVVGAIENSCNYFFYWVADQMDIDPIAETASEFGFGSSTGIEIGDGTGTLATREYKREVLGEGWYKADTLITAIGQGHNMFTPVQIANYVATIANGGTVHKLTVLDKIVSSDYSTVLEEYDPEVLNTIQDPQGYFSYLQRGMVAVAETGTASSVFSDYPVPVAAKTGTVQSDTSTINTGVFVCYAPADDPEIAVAVVVEHGGSGSALTDIARQILDEYFSSTASSSDFESDNSLIK